MLYEYDPDMEVVDDCGYEIESVHLKTIVDSDYPYEYKDHIAVCVDCEEKAYCDWTIIDETRKFLFDILFDDKEEWMKNFDERYRHQGETIRGHIMTVFPDVTKWLGGYDRFAVSMKEWTKRAVFEDDMKNAKH